MALTIGTQLGSHEITALLGKGGMGEVYRARDLKLKREVAIKILPEEFSRDADRVSRFQREAELLASVNHPNIAGIYDVQQYGDSRYLVLEFIEGETLADCITRGPIPPEEALGIAKQIAEALEAAHDRGIIHRDLKPANIKITPGDKVKVLDFGLAKATEAATRNSGMSHSPTVVSGTMGGVIIGTAAYMSPEQARGKPVDKRADIWAFGVVLYEMLTGDHLFEGETVSDILIEVATRTPDLNRVPVKFRRLLQRCLDKDPKRRLRDIGEAWFLLDDEPKAAGETVRPPRSGKIAMAVALCSTIALGALAFVHFREARPGLPDRVQFEVSAPDKIRSGPYLKLSPDGRKLAFVGMSNNRGTLWVHDTTTGESRALTPAESIDTVYASLTWSADSRFIAFAQTGKLKKVEISGASPQTICDLPAGSGFSVGAWNQEGDIIFGIQALLYRVSAAGGPPAALRSGSLPAFLGDGRHFVYLGAGAEAGGIYLSSLDAKPGEAGKRLVTTSWSAAYVPSADPHMGYLLFLREGSLMAQPFDNGRLELTGAPVRIAEQVGTSGGGWGAFSASSNGALAYWRGTSTVLSDVRLTWRDRSGNVLGTVAGDPALIKSIVLSPDDTRVASIRQSSATDAAANINIWLLDLVRGGAGTRFTFAYTAGTVWSSDGTRIAFSSLRNGKLDLYQKPVNSDNEELLLKTDEDKVPESWSRSGFLLYGVRSEKQKDDILVLPLNGDKKVFPFLATEFNETAARFSPDDRWVAYQSDESGRAEVYVRAFTPPSTSGAPVAGVKLLVSTTGGRTPRWPRNGKELFYLSLDGKVMAVDVTLSPTFHVGTPHSLFQAPRVSNNAVLWDVTSDGKRFLFAAPSTEEDATVPYTVVLNWQASLK